MAAVACSVGAAVHKAVGAAVGTIVNDMQAYTDGAEADLLKQIQELRAAEGLTSRVGESDLFDRTPRGGAETGPDGTARPRLHGDGIGRDNALHPSSSTNYSPIYHARVRPSLVFCNARGVVRPCRQASRNHRQWIFRDSMARILSCDKPDALITLRCLIPTRIYGSRWLQCGSREQRHAVCEPRGMISVQRCLADLGAINMIP